MRYFIMFFIDHISLHTRSWRQAGNKTTLKLLCSRKFHDLNSDRFNFDDLSVSEMWRRNENKVLGAVARQFSLQECDTRCVQVNLHTIKLNDLSIQGKIYWQLMIWGTILKNWHLTGSLPKPTDHVLSQLPLWEKRNIWICMEYHTLNYVINVDDYTAPCSTRCTGLFDKEQAVHCGTIFGVDIPDADGPWR